VLSGQIKIIVQKIHFFLFDCWIALKFLQEFPDTVFLEVAIQWLLGDTEVWKAKPG